MRHRIRRLAAGHRGVAQRSVDMASFSEVPGWRASFLRLPTRAARACPFKNVAKTAKLPSWHAPLALNR